MSYATPNDVSARVASTKVVYEPVRSGVSLPND